MFFLTGCNVSIQEELDGESSSVILESVISSEKTSSADSVPEAPVISEPREWKIELEEGYEPKYAESSYLYKKIKPSKDIAHKEIHFKAFGEGKIIFEYLNEKYPSNGGGESYAKGSVVVYDLETETYSTTGNHFNISTPYSGRGIVMDSGYYCTDYMEDGQGLPCMEKVNLNTGEKTVPFIFDDGINYGRAFKADETHFLIYFDVFISEGLWEGAVYIYDTQTEQAVPLPKEVSQSYNLSVWEGKLYCIGTDVRSPFSKRPQKYTITVYDLQSDEMNQFEPITGETYVLPGEALDSYIDKEKETTVHFPFDSGFNTYYIVWENGVPIQIFVLPFGNNQESLTQFAQKTGTAYFWRENVLFLVDIKTGKLHMMDMGYREKYPDMKIYTDDKGNLLLIDKHWKEESAFYFIPQSTVEKFAVPANKLILEEKHRQEK